MTGTLGHVALMALVAISFVGILVHLYAAIRGGRFRLWSRVILWAQFLLTAVASASLISLLVQENNAYAYVAEYTGPALPVLYRVAAFWGGNAGSLLFWCLVLTLYGAVVAISKHEDSDRMLPWVAFVLGLITLFFALVTTFAANPFARLAHPAAVGNGLSPLLQNPGMTVHPVNVYLGYIGFSVPFAYAMAGLILKKTDATWLRVTRRWTLISWLFLGVGIVYGAHWSYEELGWGGYWAWDPVENASLLPWLTGTAFLHSAIVQEKRGMLKGWNVILVTVTFLLTLLGTFLTRSGVLWSIHAFANGTLGRYFLVFLLLAIVGSGWLITIRWSTLRADRQFESVVSKESGFLLNNLLFLGSAFAVLWGTVFPLISQAFTGRTMMVSAPFYNAVNLPLAVCILFLMGIGPLTAWRRSSIQSVSQALIWPLAASTIFGLGVGLALRHLYHRTSLLSIFAFIAAIYVLFTVWLEFYRGVQARTLLTKESWMVSAVRLVSRNRRRYGGYIVHLAIGLMAFGIAGSGAYHVDLQQSLAVGQKTPVFGGFQALFEGIDVTPGNGSRTVHANLIIAHGGRTIGVLSPAATFYSNGQQPSSDVALYSRPLQDLYVVMLGTVNGNEAVFDFHINPLVEWIWYGGYLFILGTVLSLWPESRRRLAQVMGSVRHQAYQTLADLEYDFRMGKLDDGVYHLARNETLLAIAEAEQSDRTLKARLEQEVREVMSTSRTPEQGGESL